ncbi:MAG: DMT family transporter, partial [Spirochaetia bacterium]|nr:DMT family transporter [Spirochaetia bacterium]
MYLSARGYLFTIFASIGFGLNTIGIRYYFNSFETGTPENVAFWGMFSSSIILLPYFLFYGKARKRIQISVKRDRNIILTVAVLSTIGAYLWMLGLKEMAAGPLSLFGKSQVIYSAILGILFLKERFTLIEFAGMAAALAGIILISQLKGEVSLTAVIYVLTSAFIYSLQSMLV